jgi:hypothetical protein
LGEGFAEQLRPLTERAKAAVLGTLRKGALPEHSQLAFVRAIKRDQKLDPIKVAQFLIEVGALDGQASYTQENCANLIVRLISGIDANGLKVENLTFGIDTLRDCNLINLAFCNCYFSTSSLEMTTIKNCIFQHCNFGLLRLFNSTAIQNSMFEDCTIDALHLTENNLEIWEPSSVQAHFESIGAIFGPQQSIAATELPTNNSMDKELHDFEKLLRYFMRSTHISESVILIKLSERGNEFITQTVPELLKIGVLCQIDNHGGDKQQRFGLGQSLEKINAAISSAQGSFTKFVSNFQIK